MRELARTNDLPGVRGLNRSHTVLALFDEPLLGETVEGDEALPAATLQEMQALAEGAAGNCEALAAGHRRECTLREMASAARLTAFAARKTALGQAIRANVRQAALEPELAEGVARRLHHQILDLRALEAELETLRREWESLWLARARRSEIQVALGYFASLRTHLRVAAAWLEGQWQALLAGEPVDAQLESYDAGQHRVLWQTWPD
jgi:hypothetical protein